MNLKALGVGVLAVAILMIGTLNGTERTEPPATTSTTSTSTSTTSSTTTSSTSSSTSTSTSTTTAAPIALVGPDQLCGEWARHLIAEGWPKDRQVIETALTIMWRESRCLPTADSGPDHGLFQVNRYWCKPSQYTPTGWLQDRGLVVDCDSLFDPLVNIRSALAIYHYSLEKNGDGFLPWTTYSAKPAP